MYDHEVDVLNCLEVYACICGPANGHAWDVEPFTLHLYTQHTANRLGAPLTGQGKINETLLDSHRKVACPCHLLCDKCYMLHHVDSLHPLIACQTPPLLQLTGDQYQNSMIKITYMDKQLSKQQKAPGVQLTQRVDARTLLCLGHGRFVCPNARLGVPCARKESSRS